MEIVLYLKTNEEASTACTLKAPLAAELYQKIAAFPIGDVSVTVLFWNIIDEPA